MYMHMYVMIMPESFVCLYPIPGSFKVLLQYIIIIIIIINTHNQLS